MTLQSGAITAEISGALMPKGEKGLITLNLKQLLLKMVMKKSTM